MSDADQKMIEALMAKNKELQEENDRLKQQAAQNQSSPAAAPAAPAKAKPTSLELFAVRGKLGQLIAGQARAHLQDEDGEPIKGQRIIFTVSGTQAGTALTDANGDATMQSKAYLGDPQSWVGGLGEGYQADYRGTKEWLPSHADAPAGVSA